MENKSIYTYLEFTSKHKLNILMYYISTEYIECLLFTTKSIEYDMLLNTVCKFETILITKFCLRTV